MKSIYVVDGLKKGNMTHPLTGKEGGQVLYLRTKKRYQEEIVL